MADSLSINRVNLAPSGSGDWNVGLSLDTVTPDRVEVEGVDIQEIARMDVIVKVTQAEIAVDNSVAEVAVSTLALGVIQASVKSIAVAKTIEAIG